jgi:hypothetical protein
MNTLIHKIHEGMVVYDQEQNEIGTVDYVQFGDEDPLQPGVETATVNPAQRDTRDSLLENIIDVFRPDDIPEVLRDRLLRYGFVRVDAPGLFNADRYISPDQIQSVTENRVMLNVSKSELVRHP